VSNLRIATIDPMPTEHIVALLIAERDKLNRAIEALQGADKSITAAQPITATPKKRHVSAAARRKMAAAQKRRWAALKGEKKA
jgi:hypothetical protein